MSEMESERKKMEDELNDVLPELKSLRERLNEAKRLLDEEQLKKANLENQCSRLEEDLKFKMSLLEKELTEVKTRKEVEITEMDGKLQEEYETRLQKALEELREVYDKQMAQSREDYTKLYEDRLRELQTNLSQERGNNASGVQELKESRARIEALVSKVSDLEGANLNLNQKIADMAQEMEDMKSSHRAQVRLRNFNYSLSRNLLFLDERQRQRNKAIVGRVEQSIKRVPKPSRHQGRFRYGNHRFQTIDRERRR